MSALTDTLRRWTEKFVTATATVPILASGENYLIDGKAFKDAMAIDPNKLRGHIEVLTSRLEKDGVAGMTVEDARSARALLFLAREKNIDLSEISGLTNFRNFARAHGNPAEEKAGPTP